MSAFRGVSQFFGTNLVEIAKDLNYSPANLLILAGDKNKLMTEYPDIYENILSCSHQADARRPIQYAKDIVASWIFEDYLLRKLQNGNVPIEIELAGADRNREILPASKVSSNSDYRIKVSNNLSAKLELMCDYTGFWARTNRLHLRDQKYLGLTRESALLLGVSLLDSNLVFLDFGQPIEATYLPYHPYYHKPAYEINLEHHLEQFSYERVIQEINEYIEFLNSSPLIH